MNIKGWNKNVEDLLKNWSQQVTINENEYRKKGAYYRKWYLGIGVFIATVQTGVITSLVNLIINNESSSMIDPCSDNINQILLIVVTVVEAIVLVVQGIDKFFDFGAGSEKFYDSAKEYNALSKLIDTTLTLPRADRDYAREVLLSVRQQFSKIQETSPNLPPIDIINKLDMCIYENPSHAKGNVEDKDEVSDDNSVIINIPPSPPKDNIIHFDDEVDLISNATQCKTEALMKTYKSEVARNYDKNDKFKNFIYQWNRLEAHDEDD